MSIVFYLDRRFYTGSPAHLLAAEGHQATATRHCESLANAMPKGRAGKLLDGISTITLPLEMARVGCEKVQTGQTCKTKSLWR